MAAHGLSPKQKIFYAAIDCFSGKSYSECTMDMIAGKIGVTAASIYNHYKSKDAILQNIFDYYTVHFNRHRIPMDEIIRAAENKPIREIIPMLFLSFGSNEDAEVMTKITRIINNLKLENIEATRIYKICFYHEPHEYFTAVLRKLVELGRIAPIDIETYSFLLLSLANNTLTAMQIFPDNAEEYNAMRETGAELLAKIAEI